ncbi:sulfatase-like hydrolase/transferase [Pseudomonas cremoricolorata]|uniref:Sulfatase n=1 Tax=Pseudomonas cremoricolorata TaxID=157783 RepID=A0A089WW45_9PSED|nr:sulfatase-like hydrolase/transferase [Pseudomonas cremoricolorata]AIR90827.1 sulfatase [Pseudomonas cremoricolorata]
MRGWIKALLLLAYLGCFHQAIADRVQALGAGLALLLFVGMFSVLAAALWLAAWTRPMPLRWALAILLASSAAMFDAYGQITESYLTYSAFVSMVYSAGFILEALQQYGHAIALAVGKALLVLLGIGIRPPAAMRVPRGLPVAAPLLALGLLIAVLFVRAGEGARGLPVMYTPLAYLTLLGYESLHAGLGPRQPVSLTPAQSPSARHIVLVIDESIAGNYLDINTPGGVSTPLSQALPQVEVYNFGYAASVANCSADTNVTLRYGGTRQDYLRINATGPSIWQYAKAAGLHTVYIDGQRTGGALQNLMTRSEQNDIDQFIQFDDTSVQERDMAAAARLIELLASPQPQLIVINKVGAHFPVHDKYPDAFMHYRPALSRGRYVDVADTGERAGFDGSPSDWQRYRNAYRNTLLWNVGEFFNRLLHQADFRDTVLIYTSDHGQDLHERGNPGLNTHCGSDPNPEEGLVPLLVLQGRGLRSLDWQAHLAQNRNASSHYNIFPTLLLLMGYGRSEVSALYGRSLDVPTIDPFTFNARFNARLGAKPDFRHIDVQRLQMPDQARDIAASKAP